jgi:hypothetical protein
MAIDRFQQPPLSDAELRLQTTLRDGYDKSFKAAGGTDIYQLRIVQTLDKAGASATGRPLVIKAWLPDTFNLDISADYDTPFAQLLESGKFQMARNIFRAQSGNSLIAQDMTVQVWSGSAPWDFSLPFVFTADKSAAQDVVLPIKQLAGLITPARNSAGFLISPGPTVDVGQAISQFGKGVSEAMITTGNQMDSKTLQYGGQITEALSEAVDKVAGFITGSKKETTQSPVAQREADRRLRQNQDAEQAGTTTQTSDKIRNRVSLHVGKYMYFPAVIVTSVGKTYNTIFDKTGKPVRATVNVNFRTMVTPVKAELDQMFRE